MPRFRVAVNDNDLQNISNRIAFEESGWRGCELGVEGTLEVPIVHFHCLNPGVSVSWSGTDTETGCVKELRIDVYAVESEGWNLVCVLEQWLVIPRNDFPVDYHYFRPFMEPVLKFVFRTIIQTHRTSSKVSRMRRPASFARVTLPTR
jgi:hypothetical protein